MGLMLFLEQNVDLVNWNRKDIWYLFQCDSYKKQLGSGFSAGH